MNSFCLRTSIIVALISGSAVQANDQPATNIEATDLLTLRDQLQAERLELQRQEKLLEAQRARLQRLEERLLGQMRGAGPGQEGGGTGGQMAAQTSPVPSQTEGQVEEVGARPEEKTAPPEVAVLADQGSIMTKAGRITIEPSLEFAHADRNRFVFRGIEVPQSVLVGVFDINESRQDILTAAIAGRFGLTNRLEIGARVPFVYRDDKAVLVPIANEQDDINTSADATGIGDIEVSARYQLTNGSGGWPFLIAGIQAIIPTGKDPFDQPRDSLGNATKAATGAGFWGVAPNLTILMPSDPATIFASVGYTFNFGKDVDERIGDVFIERVVPGGAPNATVGVGIALNPELSLSLAYAHTWQFGTDTRFRFFTRPTPNGPEVLGDPVRRKTRDQQVGRFLFGIGYRVNPRTTINWTVEMGATDDASDIRTTLRIPFTLN